MHVDHLTFVAGPEGLADTVEQLSHIFGDRFKDGGVHPSFGTRNNIMPLTDGRYLEVVEVLNHPAVDKAVYGQAVRQRQETGGGWLGWVVSVDDLSPYEKRLDRKSVKGSRRFPDGRLLEWEQIGVKGLMTDAQLPYFVHWKSDAEVLPSALPGDVTLASIDIAGSKQRVEEWLGAPMDANFDGVHFDFTAPHGAPAILAVTFDVPGKGSVRI